MKRRICAVLLFCVLCLGTTAGAVAATASTFKDQKTITQTEAVQVMSLLGIMGGYQNGKFVPKGKVTRAEMAKMLFVLCTGSSDASNYSSISVPYKDLSSNWAINYIRYCYNAGLLSSGSKFYPDTSVTALEASKMLLILDGYNSSRAGFTGSKWSTNVLKYASARGLLKKITISLTGPLTREFAAQLMRNAIDIDAVQWSSGAGSYILTGETLGARRMKLVEYKGILLSAMGASIDKEGETRLTETRIQTGSSSTEVMTVKNMTHNYSNLLGKHVVAYSRSSGVNYGIVADDYNTVDLEVKGGKIKAIDGKNKITVDKKEYDVNTQKGVIICTMDAVKDKDNSNVYDVSGTTRTIVNSPLDLAAAITSGGSGTAHVISNDGDYAVDVIVFYTSTFVKQYFVK